MTNFWLTYSRTDRRWILKKEKSDIVILHDRIKTEAWKKAVAHLQKRHHLTGEPASLKRMYKGGGIQGERTIPRSADPRSSRG